MNKGSFKQIFTGKSTHRISKVATLALTTSVLVAMVAIDASASPKGISTAIAGPTRHTPVFASEASLSELFSFGRHHDPVKPAKPKDPTTTTTTPVASGGGSGTSTPTTPVTSGGGGGGGGTPAPTTTTTDPAPPTTTTTTPAPSTPTTTDPAPSTPSTTTTPYPLGVADSAAVSGYDPPTADALPGFTQSYVTAFSGTSLPSGWSAYSGAPGGDSGAQWSASHVVVSNGFLSLNTFQDPAYGNEWVTGGLCQCAVSNTYGAYFVRSRVTGAGPTNVELLWPTYGWPPEIDFNETYGGTTSTSATVHFGASNSQDGRTLNSIDMTQWHTWGVIWTPESITYTVDGQVWGTVTNTSEIPDQPMTLDLQQQTWCSSGFACPTSPQSMQISWVAEYTPNS